MSLNQQIDAHAVHSGWLYKKGFYNTSWKKRFFVLYDDRTIHYFTQASHASNRHKAKGKIHLTQIRRVELVTYNDPNNRNRKSSHTQSPHSRPIYRTNSLPIDPTRSHSMISYASSSSCTQYRNTRNHDPINIPLSPTMHTSFTYNRTSKSKYLNTISSMRRSTYDAQSAANSQTYNAHSLHAQQRRLERTSSAENTSISSLSTSTRCPLQSISEMESIDPIPRSITPAPFSLNSGYTASATDFMSHIRKRTLSPVHSVNGWSFSDSNEETYFSAPSNIISSAQPPPDYDQILQNEKQNKHTYLDASLLALKQSYYDRNPAVDCDNMSALDLNSNNGSNIPDRRHSANSAQIKAQSSLSQDKHRGRSASQSYTNAIQGRPLALPSSCTTTIQSVPNVVPQKGSASASLVSFGDQSTSQSTDTVECELSDNELNMELSRSRYDENKDIILSTGIRSHKSSLSTECSQYDLMTGSRKDEYDIFQSVMGDSQLGLCCDRRYSFSLIHPNRDYILSAESNDELKDWISIFSRLTQGKPVLSGYLALKDKTKDNIWSKKFFILFENKVLNYYRHHDDVHNDKSCEFDIDLRHVMWLRYCAKNEFADKIKLKQYFAAKTKNNYLSTPSGNSVINPFLSRRQRKKKHSVYSLEIAIPNRVFIMTADSLQTRNGWYNQIRNVFADTLMLKRYYDSSVSNIYMVHSDSNYKNRYIAFFGGIGLVIFQNKKVLKTIKRMTFFDEMVFKDYIRKKHCTIIPINNNVNVRRATSDQHGQLAFVVSNHGDQRKWYFDCSKKRILDKWIYLLVDKRWMNTPKPRLKKKKKKKQKKKMKTYSCDFVTSNLLSAPKESPTTSKAPVSPHAHSTRPSLHGRKNRRQVYIHSDLARRHSAAHSDDLKHNFVYSKTVKTKRSTSLDAHDVSPPKRASNKHVNLDAMFRQKV